MVTHQLKGNVKYVCLYLISIMHTNETCSAHKLMAKYVASGYAKQSLKVIFSAQKAQAQLR